LLDTWQRSGLPAGDFAALVGLSKHALYDWKKKFAAHGPAGLLDQPRGAPTGSKLPELTRRAILMLEQAHPDWGCQRISDLLARGPALPASPQAVARVLHEAGYTLEEVPTRPHAAPRRRFERDRTNQLWQADLFTFVRKRQNRRVYLVGFLDDHSRFVVGCGLHASQSTALVLEVLRAALAGHVTPQEILTDNGSRYVTWRGQSAFSRELEKRGIRQIVARPRHPLPRRPRSGRRRAALPRLDALRARRPQRLPPSCPRKRWPASSTRSRGATAWTACWPGCCTGRDCGGRQGARCASTTSTRSAPRSRSGTARAARTAS
jgi:transposase